MILKKMKQKELINPPRFLVDNTQYLVRMGSEAYGCSSDNSDVDFYGWCIPPKDMIFPHLRGEIDGFGTPGARFNQWQEHHVFDINKTYDFTIYSIVKFFHLCMQNNPNIVDSLFVPFRCINHCSQLGGILRDNRKVFLHKEAWHRFKGYAYSQLHKIALKQPEGKRKELVEKFGFDVKFGYHVVRLILEVEQILIEQDLDLERNSEQLKAIRRGEWTEERIRNFLSDKERDLEQAYVNSPLPNEPDEEKIKGILLTILEQHFGNLDKAISRVSTDREALKEIKEVLERYNIH